ncbi:uncharacterized protein LOC111638520 isoform X2 [Centruroides sculpturatus]|nr:uncharacterized protein LOC111626201 isoform X2 [Centruroides sculpturatus]XP_023225278.1 uncharacterized protein LOC111626201 isoform X2 [Centruroides sculpturatus]XP_023240005.1 uncharacterized protein LOC111638520 isoform X2 [Centruroides sculpturatus]XP_023240006.1 uncharacterized protein LOC111638520 isoform X2 [Centruroides sculpturatus]
MKGIFLIFISSLLFTMVLGDNEDDHDHDHYDDNYVDQYCGVINIDCFDYCLQVFMGEEYYERYRKCNPEAVADKSPGERQYYICNVATEEEIATANACTHKDEEEIKIFHDGFEVCVIYETLGLIFPQLFCSCTPS